VTENNRSYGIREQIKIQVWKRYRITPTKFNAKFPTRQTEGWKARNYNKENLEGQCHG